MSRPTAAPPETITTNSVDSIRRSRDRVWEHRFVWLLLFAILGLWGYFFLISKVDTKLTREIQKQIRKEFPAHLVFIDRAHLLAGQSITIEGIRIAKPTDQGLRDVLRCGRLVCSGPIELIGLIQGQLPVQKVVADGVELCVWPLSDGRMSVQELARSKPLTPNLPTIDVKSGLIRLGNETGRAEQEIICHDLRANIGLAPRWIGGRVAPLSARIAASVSSSYFNTISIDASIGEDKTNWIAQGRVTKLEYSQRLVNQLPRMIQQYLSNAAGFSGELNSEFKARSDQGQVTFEANSTLSNGRLLHPQVPYPLESLSGEIYCKNGLLQLSKFQASSGQTSVAFACNMYGFSIGSPLQAAIKIQNLSLDQRLYQAVPVSFQETWRKLNISGLVDAEATLQFDGKNWTPKLDVHAKSAGIETEFFPYPVKNISGDIVYQNGCIEARELVGIAGEQRIRGALKLSQAQPRWLMDLKLAADGPISIDEALLKALSPRGAPQSSLQKFVLSLHPRGTVMLNKGHFVRTAENPENISRSLELTFSECSIKYDAFRYPIVDIHGEATLDNERMLLKGFVGRNDGARINGQGVCQCRNSNLESIDLLFDGYDVGLDEELQQALPTSVRGLWDQLQPSGVLDHVAIQIRRKDSNSLLDLRVEITEDRDSESHAGRAVSVRPVSLPYQINDVACNIVYRPGRIEIKALSGMHDASRLQTEGQCQLYSDGTWTGELKLDSTRLIVDQSLLNCLPSYLREPLVRVDFRGPISIAGKTRVSSPPTASESIVREWDLELQIEDGRLGGGGIASGIRGSITLAGENTSQGPMAFGILYLDALAIKNVAVTGVEGPFAFNHQELLFGRDATTWQSKNNLRPPSFSQVQANGPVINANYLVPSHASSSVSQASFRSTLHESLLNRPGILNRNAPSIVENPNTIRTTEGVPELDIKTNDVRARTLSGTIFISGVESLDTHQRSKYRLRLVDADLQGLLLDLGETNTNVSGRLSIQCDLQGALTNTSTLEGQGRGWLRKANLYEVPAIIRLFRMLSVTPGQGAFDSADIQFGIDGERLPIHELVLDGDIVSMRGSGWVNMRRELHLDMYANVGRRGMIGAIFHPIAKSSAGKLWQIEVNGTTNDPQIRRPMPLMNKFDMVLPNNNNGSNP